MTTPTAKRVTELTLRGVILGILITGVFTAANVYLGLKVGLTFATSIPAAVISMAILSAFKDASILENNIVQTVASAAGTLSAIIFVLPGLVIVGWWAHFPFWESFWVCASGGILGVLFTIPLRRAMVTTSDLPYPEGVAAAEVLEVGSQTREASGGDKEARQGLFAVIYGSIASAGLAIFAATRVMMGEVTGFFRLGYGAAASGYDFAFSLALMGVGHLVGLSVGMAMLLGIVIAWGVSIPILTVMTPAHGQALGDFVSAIFHQVRFIGAGAIAVAAIWTLMKLATPVLRGIAATMTASRAKAVAGDTRDVDMSPFWIGLICIACLIVIAWLLREFLGTTPLTHEASALVFAAVPFIFIGGFVISAITGYMAGLIGASNSPVSGVGILAIICCAVLFVAVSHPDAGSEKALVAYALFATAIVFSVATISNNNLQDLKTGQLVGATPRAQQWALIIGVIAGSIVIPPVLDLLNQAYGFAGAPRLASAVAQPLGAPQANLISALAQGVIEHRLDAKMLGIGCLLGVVLVLLDEFLGARKWLRLPPLAVGIGIYLPMSATAAVVIGSVLGHLYERWSAHQKKPERAKQLGVLVASGMIVGESLFGVVLAGLIVAAQQGYIPAADKGAPLALVPADYSPAPLIGLIAFTLVVLALYRWAMRTAKA
jgi:putative OPT family oligopeptide transporter